MSLLSKDSTIEDRANRVYKNKVLRRILPIILSVIFILLTIIYVISIMYTRFGSFTVSVNKYHQLQYGLSLCETPEFTKPTSMLNCRASELITNIDGKSLDKIDLGAVNGSDSGSNYLCYTFYCKNTGKEIVTYEYSIIIANMTLNIEKAVRVRLITNVNGQGKEQVDYARAAGVDDENNQIPEPGTVPFPTKNTVVSKQIENFAPGDITKFTVVIWLEGNDPECIDDIIGGEFKIDMKFSVVGIAGQDELPSEN